MRLFVVCLGTLVISACSNSAEPVPQPEVASPARWANLSKTCTENSPAYPLPANLGGPINITASSGTERDAYIARSNPGGWGGRAFRDPDQYFMYFVDTTRAQEVFATLRQRGILVPNDLELRRGRWDYAQLYEWSQYFSLSLTPQMSFYSLIDVPLNRLELITTSEANRLKLDSTLSALDIPCFLAAIAVEPPGPPRGL